MDPRSSWGGSCFLAVLEIDARGDMSLSRIWTTASRACFHSSKVGKQNSGVHRVHRWIRHGLVAGAEQKVENVKRTIVYRVTGRLTFIVDTIRTLKQSKLSIL